VQNRVSVTHSKKVDFDKLKAQLGIYATSWEQFMARANDLASRRVSNEVTKEFLVSLFGKKDVPAEEQTEQDNRAMRQVYALFEGTGKGSQLDSACGTAWGLVNAVTEYVDHHTTVSDPLDSAWFGAGAVLKQRAVQLADKLTANV
jgi:phage/plasmid-like protein (TIGR03299 family)